MSLSDVVILVERLGPYHVARYSSLQDFMKIKVIEIDPADDTYQWSGVDKTEIHDLIEVQGEGFFFKKTAKR